MALDLSIVRQHVETGLVDAALTRLMEDAVEEVEARFGTDDPVTETIRTSGEKIVLRRAAQSITSVSTIASDGSATALDPSEYELNGRVLERLSGGVISYDWVTHYDAPEGWDAKVRVVYVPVPEATLRDRVALDLIRLAVQYQALQTQKVGDYSMSAVDYHNERERILRGVANRRGLRI